MRTVLDDSQGYLHDGALLVRCHLEVVVGKVARGQATLDPSPLQELSSALGALLASRSGADVVIKVDGRSLDAHSAILAARSPVFAAMLASPMREGREKEVVIADLEASSVEALLLYLYTGSIGKETLESDASSLSLLQAAHRYQVNGLVDRVAQSLAARFDVATVSEWAQVADLMGCSGFREQCLSFMRQHIAEVQSSDAFQRLAVKHPAILVDVIAALAPPAKQQKKS
ncbi:unnamed protein product [Polarella glacialis]|nr:unnamed protein product [Polarella glacialis]